MSFWQGRRVFLTGHTGFKGSWLALWLTELGAEVTGFSLPPPTDPSLFEAARVAGGLRHIIGDIRHYAGLKAAMKEARPEVVFHLAAQPLVRLSYAQPMETYATNVMGTVHVLEAVRQTEGVRSVVAVTTDKCYENLETGRAFREDDAMGGHDPYSSSKGCSELVISAYRRSYFDPSRLAEHGVGVASARAGNVIGGGDWADNRLVPDIVQALLDGVAPVIRYPNAVRPWQHVLEPLRGYMMLAQGLHGQNADFAEGWNFGPALEDSMPVEAIVERLAAHWGAPGTWELAPGPQLHEAGALRLDTHKAERMLGWRPALPLDDALAFIADWTKALHQGGDARALTLNQIHDYEARVAAMSGATSAV